jgi:hypothetical protein
MLNQSFLSVVNSVQADMRPWIYQLVRSQMEKAIQQDDNIAIEAFLPICTVNAQWTMSPLEQFTLVKDKLQSSQHKDEHFSAIHNAFQTIYGDIEGM